MLLMFIFFWTSNLTYAGSLIGDSIEGRLNYNNLVNHQPVFTSEPVIIVEPGEEFRGIWSQYGTRQRVEAFADFAEDTVTLGFQHVAGDLGASYGCCPNITFTFTDLDFDCGNSIIGLNLVSRTGNDKFTFSHTANSITVTIAILALPAGGSETIKLEIIPEPEVLVGLDIVGPDEVAGNFQAQYRTIVHYGDNSTRDVTDLAEWSVEPNDYASINDKGLLTTEDIYRDRYVTIFAEYSKDGNTVSASKEITIFPICPSGTALSFDGTDDYVDIGDTASLSNLGNITIGVWINPNSITATAAGYRIISKWMGGNQEFMVKHSQSTKGGSGEIVVGFYTKFNNTSNFNLNADTWTHLAVVWNGSIAVEVYKNGILVETLSLASTSPFDSSAPTVIGKHGSLSQEYFNGTIDDVRIYDRALSAEEIQELMHTRPDTDDPTLVGYWGFDEGEGDTAGDSSGNGNDGTVVGAAWVESDAPVGICYPVDVDIKPGSCPNPLNLISEGVLPVAVLGSEDFDVSTIDAVSVRLAGIAPIRHNYEDVATPVTDGNECECSTEGPDGYDDLTVKFRTQEIVEELINGQGELVDGQTLVLTLRGELYDDTAIEGADCVVLVGNVPKWLAARGSDINGDGVVNIFDFAELANYWLESCEPE